MFNTKRRENEGGRAGGHAACEGWGDWQGGEVLPSSSTRIVHQSQLPGRRSPHPLFPQVIDLGLDFLVRLELQSHGVEERARALRAGVEGLRPRVHGAEGSLQQMSLFRVPCAQLVVGLEIRWQISGGMVVGWWWGDGVILLLLLVVLVVEVLLKLLLIVADAVDIQSSSKMS